jgi:hypothetical protein
LLRAGEDEATGPPICIDNALKVRKEVRPSLRLVEDGTFCEASEKAARVFVGKGVFDRVFQADIGFVGKQVASQCCFAGLPWAGNSQYRKAAGQSLERRGN